MADTFGQPEISQQEPLQPEGTSPKLIVFLLVIILGGGAVLGYLLYKQSQEPPIVLDEVVESIEVPTTNTGTLESVDDTPLMETNGISDTDNIVPPSFTTTPIGDPATSTVE